MAALAGVVDQGDGAAVLALELAEVCEERRDLGCGVLVDSMQSHEWIKDQEPRLQSLDLLAQALAVAVDVEADDGVDDHVDVEAVQRDMRGGADPL